MLKRIVQWWYEKMEGPYAHYLAHFMGGFMVAAIAGHFWGATDGLLAGIAAAVLKELLDRYTSLGTPELRAAAITAAGAALGYWIGG